MAGSDVVGLVAVVAMMATPYERGRSFEYRVRNHLQAMGYLVARSPASKSAFDLIAICESGDEKWKQSPVVLLIQCKLDGKFSKKEQNELIRVADSVGAMAFLAEPGAKRRGVELIQLDSE